MHLSAKIFVLVILLGSVVLGQELTREQKLQKIDELNTQIRILQEAIIPPAAMAEWPMAASASSARTSLVDNSRGTWTYFIRFL